MPPKRAIKQRQKEEKAEKARTARERAAATARAVAALEQEAAVREAAAAGARETTRLEVKELAARVSLMTSKARRVRAEPAGFTKSVRAELQTENSFGEPAVSLGAEEAHDAAQRLAEKMEATLLIDRSGDLMERNEPPEYAIDVFRLFNTSPQRLITLDATAEYRAIQDNHMRRWIANCDIGSEDEEKRRELVKQVAVDVEQIYLSAQSQMVGRKESSLYEPFGMLFSPDPVESEKVKDSGSSRLRIKWDPRVVLDTNVSAWGLDSWLSRNPGCGALNLRLPIPPEARSSGAAITSLAACTEFFYRAS
ncbi:hypothetical protein HDU86_006063 [Geranomyces michiganensis]|nr:hypothetical protein HDU86_006063 [Geranomyces michiganensis]